jgi:O-succinylbenzoic acid--CoA ligase
VIALWKLGAIPVPVNVRLTNDDINKLISLCDCKLALVDSELKIKSSALNINSITFPFSESSAPSKVALDLQPQFISTAVIIFTSGTSDTPKAVELSFKSLYENARIGNKILYQTSNDRWLASLPFYHIGGFSIICRALLYSTSIVFPESHSTEDLAASIDIFKPTLCSLVPTQLKRLIEFDIPGKESLRHLLIGGGFSNEDLILTAYKQGWNITKVYGSTETSAFVTAITGDELLAKPKSAGKVISPNIIKIINDKGIDLINGDVGEIIINTPAIMKGYYKNKTEFENNFKGEFYKSGDFGFLDEEGDLFVEARRIDLIVSGGENINAIEVENAIASHPEIEEAAVIPSPDEEWGQAVTAVVVMKKNNPAISLDNLNKFLRNELADFKLPKKIIIENQLPKSELGKIEKEKLLKLYRL